MLVVGLSVDYCVHLAEGYSRSTYLDRKNRTRDSLTEVNTPGADPGAKGVAPGRGPWAWQLGVAPGRGPGLGPLKNMFPCFCAARAIFDWRGVFLLSLLNVGTSGALVPLTSIVPPLCLTGTEHGSDWLPCPQWESCQQKEVQPSLS